MFICICNGITDREIRAAAATGVSNLSALQSRLGVATQCGQCAEAALAVLGEQSASRDHGSPLFYSAQAQLA